MPSDLPLTSAEQPRPDEPVFAVVRLRHERNRTWCLAGTFVLCLTVLVFLFILALGGRTAETFVAGGSGVVALGTWQSLLRFYFPASSGPGPKATRSLQVVDDDPAVA